MSRWGSFNENFGGPQGGFGNNDDGFDEDEFPWDNPQQAPYMRPWFRNPRKSRYDDAYGDYRGGYGPGGGFGPRPFFPPPPPLGPPPPPPPARSMWGRGFGPRGPPRRNLIDDRAIKYLMRCGLTKEQLKNLPHDLLRLIEPEYCGLCDFCFDNFPMSRMHYISKNHLKNQKKWLTRVNGSYKTNEAPLKARNLYCELCDIQITSATHGDAHYNGKPHRGIVDGRKKPKNPLLLQNGMQNRLDQLIRREKRCLKPVKEKVEEAEPSKDVKIATPELYCSICKSTATCSEQMTMHLNGKRHLSKEKQHILNMMKGETDEVKKDDEDEEEDEDEAEGEAGENNDEKDEKDEWGEDQDVTMNEKADEGDDWGNEAWDSQENKAKE